MQTGSNMYFHQAWVNQSYIYINSNLILHNLAIFYPALLQDAPIATAYFLLRVPSPVFPRLVQSSQICSWVTAPLLKLKNQQLQLWGTHGLRRWAVPISSWQSNGTSSNGCLQCWKGIPPTWLVVLCVAISYHIRAKKGGFSCFVPRQNLQVQM